MDSTSRNKVLVTGGAGLIGSHLCARLLARGDEVICLDDFTSGLERTIEHLKEHARFHLLQADVCDPTSLAGLDDVTRIYNLACPASPPFYQADSLRTMRICVQGAFNVLDLAQRTGARVLQTSTSEVYGDPLVHPQVEGYRGNVSCTGPRACYDEGKRAAETIFFDYHRQHGVDIRVVRIFNTYGPNMRIDDGRVVSNFICQALRGADLTVYGDGLQTRSFCYVDDLVDGLVRMMEQDCFIGPVNLGNPEERTMLDLAELVVKLVGSSSRITHADLPQDDPTCRCPDITVAREQLGWAPSTSLCDGLDRTIAYFRDVLDG